jgi:hypothetical protein
MKKNKDKFLIKYNQTPKWAILLLIDGIKSMKWDAKIFTKRYARTDLTSSFENIVPF